MATKEINCFGFDIYMSGKCENRKEPYQFVKSGNDVYVRFDATTGDCPIVKINKNGDEYTQTWSYGKWADKSTLTYKPINETISVEC